jgi:hypothetical protein
LGERTAVKLDPVADGHTKYLFSFTGLGGPDQIDRVGDFDYLDFPVGSESRIDAPIDWGGMSGGGIWQVPLKKGGAGPLPGPPLLAGLMFFQYATTATRCGIKGHGPRSIYHVAYDAIVGGKRMRFS